MTTANKAIAAAVLAALVQVLAELRDKAPVSTIDYVILTLGALVTGLTVYLVPNAVRRT